MGLNFKLYDQFKEQYWMSDYRYVLCPQDLANGYSKNLFTFALLYQGISVQKIMTLSKQKENAIIKHRAYMEDGATCKKKDISEFYKKSTNMRVHDYGKAYILHKKLGYP